MAKTIAIIGAGGAMGKWFSEYFSKKGFEVTGFDNTNPVAKNIKKVPKFITNCTDVVFKIEKKELQAPKNISGSM